MSLDSTPLVLNPYVGRNPSARVRVPDERDFDPVEAHELSAFLGLLDLDDEDETEPVQKHGSHDQKTHGNWARGGARGADAGAGDGGYPEGRRLDVLLAMPGQPGWQGLSLADYRLSSGSDRFTRIWQQTFAGHRLVKENIKRILDDKTPITVGELMDWGEDERGNITSSMKVGEERAFIENNIDSHYGRINYDLRDLALDLEGAARFVIGEYANSPVHDTRLYRGINMTGPRPEVGERISMLPSSWGVEANVASMYGDDRVTGITFITEGPVRSLDLDSIFNNDEHVMGGTFEIVRRSASVHDGQPSANFYIRQIDDGVGGVVTKAADGRPVRDMTEEFDGPLTPGEGRPVDLEHVTKHGSHDQKTHGNWAHGNRSTSIQLKGDLDPNTNDLSPNALYVEGHDGDHRNLDIRWLGDPGYVHVNDVDKDTVLAVKDIFNIDHEFINKDGIKKTISSRVTSVTSSGSLVSISGHIVYQPGNDVPRSVGTFERAIDTEMLQVEHQYMKIENAMQGIGFAKAFLAQSEAHYRAHGIKSVTVDASMSVGGYAWARAGFEFRRYADDSGAQGWRDPQHPITRLKAFAEGGYAHGALDAAMHDEGDLGVRWRNEALRLYREKGDRVTPFEISEIGRPENPQQYDGRNANPNNMWPGRAILLGSHWTGIKYLDTTTTDMEVAKAIIDPHWDREPDWVWDETVEWVDGDAVQKHGGNSHDQQSHGNRVGGSVQFFDKHVGAGHRVEVFVDATFAGAMDYRLKGGDAIEVFDVYVSAVHQRQGLASRLYEHVLTRHPSRRFHHSALSEAGQHLVARLVERDLDHHEVIGRSMEPVPPGSGLMRHADGSLTEEVW